MALTRAQLTAVARRWPPTLNLGDGRDIDRGSRSGRWRGLCRFMLITLLPGGAKAFDTLGPTWANGDIVLHLQLGQPSGPLLDGSPDWATVAQSAIDEWNGYLGRSRLRSLLNSTSEVRRGNRINNVAFRADVYGSAFGERTLAVTLGTSNTATGRYFEQDVLFNSTVTWN